MPLRRSGTQSPIRERVESRLQCRPYTFPGLVCPVQIGPELVTHDFDCDDKDPRVNPYFGNCGR